MVRNGTRSQFIVLVHKLTYFGKLDTKDKSCYTGNEDTRIFLFLSDSLFIEFGGAFINKLSAYP